LAEALVTLLAAQFIVHPLVVDHVIPVHASGDGLQVGGTVNVRNAEGFQVGRRIGRVIKCKVFMELETVRG
jgi:hypothetical protein